MLIFAAKYGKNVYSQNGEDGIIEECIARIRPEYKFAAEIGAPTWTYCSNTAYLSDKDWYVNMYDIDPADTRVSKIEIRVDNINQIIYELVSVLSIDIDNNDYHVWKAYKGNPAIVIIEINSGIEPVLDMIPGTQGASYKSMVELGISKGYFLLCHTGNLIWVLNKYKDLFPEVTGDPLKDHDLYFNKSFL